MSNRNGMEKDSNLSGVMQKMRDTLIALGIAFDQVMALHDPIDSAKHEIGEAIETHNKKREFTNL